MSGAPSRPQKRWVLLHDERMTAVTPICLLPPPEHLFTGKPLDPDFPTRSPHSGVHCTLENRTFLRYVGSAIYLRLPEVLSSTPLDSTGAILPVSRSMPGGNDCGC